MAVSANGQMSWLLRGARTRAPGLAPERWVPAPDRGDSVEVEWLDKEGEREDGEEPRPAGCLLKDLGAVCSCCRKDEDEADDETSATPH